MTHNLINIKDHPHDFKDSRLSYSVSSRNIRPDIDIIDYLKILYMYCDLKQIDSVFGHTTSFSKLYGGRVFKLAYALTRDHLDRMADMGYGRFKLIPIPSHGFEQTARHYSTQKKYFIRTMKQRKGLYYLCSYPKCGRTWVRFMLANYINLFFDLKRDIDLHSMFYFFPDDKAGGRKGPETYGACDDHRFPLLLSSHEPYTPDMFENENIVFLLRSIPDVVVSDYFQMSRFLGRFKGSLKDYVRDEKGGLERYCRYLNTWIPRLAKDCAVILTYEKLHQDSMQALSDILNFMAIPCDQQIARQAIKLSSFHQMQKKEQEKKIPDSENNFNDPEARRMRKGLPGGFADYLDRETLEYMNRRCSKILKKETQQFLSTWGIAPDVVTQKIGT